MTVLGLVRTPGESPVCRSCGHATAAAEGPLTHLVRHVRHESTCRRWVPFDMIDEDRCRCDDVSHRH